MSVNVPVTSRLANTAWTKESNGTEDIEFWDLPIQEQIRTDPTDTILPVDKSWRIDGLASDFYGDPSLWDVIAETNGFRILPQDMKTGEKIRIPTYQRVLGEIRT